MADRDPASNLEFWSARSRHGAADHDPGRPPKPYRRRRFARLRVRRRSFGLPTFRMPAWRLPAVHLPASLGRAPSRGSDDAEPGRERGRTRPVAAALLLAGLTGAWLFVGHHSHRPAVAGRPAPVAASTPSTAPRTTAPRTTTPAKGAPSGTGRAAPPANAIAHAVVTTIECVGLSIAQPHVRCAVRDAPVVEERALYTSATVAAAFRRIAGAPVGARSGPAACASGHPDERAWSIAAAPQFAVGRYLCRIEDGRAAMWWTHGDRLLHALGNEGDLAALFAWWSAHPSE